MIGSVNQQIIGRAYDGKLLIQNYADSSADGRNLFVGADAGNLTLSPAGGASTLASRNVGLGSTALDELTTGYQNTGIGNAAGSSLTTGYLNTIIGSSAGVVATTAHHNCLIGSGAGLSMTSGVYNTAVGHEALYNDADGYANTAIGYLAMYSHAGGAQAQGYNTSVGCESLYGNTDGIGNTAIGYATGYQNATGDYNIFLGHRAGKYETGSNKLYIDSLDRSDEATGRTNSLIYGVVHTLVANQSLALNAHVSIANNLTMVATTATAGIVYRGANRFLHSYAHATADGHNLFLGVTAGNLTSTPAGGASTLASRNVGIGRNCLSALTTGYNNVALGDTAAVSVTSGFDNVSVGKGTGISLNTGSKNVLVGNGAGLLITSATYDTAIGFEALYNDANGYANTAVGYLAMYSHAGGAQAQGYNTGIGVESFYSNTIGIGNTGLGYASGFQNVTGSYNVFLGHRAGKYETGSNKLYIDSQDRTDEATGRTNSLIYGVFDLTVANQELRFNAGKMGFFGTAAVSKPTGVAVTAEAIHAALVTMGLISS